jgi:membrane peptidoglycan carboxypeptidase
MTPPQSSPPRTVLGNLTQAVQTIQAKVGFSKLALKPDARVPELWIQDAGAEKAQVYPLLGDRYLIGRSSKSCDIVIRNPIVSQIHASLERDRQHKNPFVVKDENSTNGIFQGKRRVKARTLHHKDVLTFGPPELEASVRVQYIDPPPWYVQTARYSLYGAGSLVGLLLLWVGIEWQKFSVRPLPASTQGPVVVMARDGETPLRRRRDQVHRELKRLPEFSPYLAKALLASEDSRYYWHLGVDPLGILRALLVNLTGGGVQQGGSTLTQQLARSLLRNYVGTENSIGRKLREAVVALKLETVYSKDFLLLTYLNKIYLGNDLSGFEDAARFYFGKSAADLTLSEAATLVGILPAPNAFNPVRDYDTAIQYRDRVINRMAAQGKITNEEANRARRSRIEISPTAAEELQSTIAPYYYSYVFQELENLLGEQLAQEGNFIVETGLDLKMQTSAEAAVRNGVSTSGAAYNFSQAALITANFKTGEIRALVGGTDYNQSQFNRATQALRQPGSTFKIFAYTAAIESGISPGRSYSCAPVTWQGQGFPGCRSGAGSMDLYTGLAQSENPIALRVAQDVGLEKVIGMAHRMGVESKLDPVPGLTLGQSEVTLLEMTSAFSLLANQGVRTRPQAITKILDAGDCPDPKNQQSCRVIYDRSQDADASVKVLDPGVASTMTRLLRGVVRSGTGRSAALGMGEAGKTGTNGAPGSPNNRDLWFIGYVPGQNLVTSVWLGNDDNQPTNGTSAQAARLWGTYMKQIISQSQS